MHSLNHRSLLSISGADRKKFLQGLITNNVNKASADKLIYTAMLNAQGRFLYDFFIFEDGEKLVLDCPKSRRDEILQKLNFFKLRSQLEIKKNDDLAVFWYQNELNITSDYFLASNQKSDNQAKIFTDPRHQKMGFRIYTEKFITSQENADYDLQRIFLKIPEAEKDLAYEKSFIAEFGFDNLNAVDYQKGCYLGQEPTARIHHLGQVRKKIFHIEIADLAEGFCAKGEEIFYKNDNVGIVLSSVFDNNKLHALALIRFPKEEKSDDFFTALKVGELSIFIVS